MQYLMWPEGRDERLAQLSGNGVHDWDHVIIAGDPYIVRQMPGYHALGANQVAQHVVDGGAQAHLLMVWGQENEGSMSGIIRRIGARAKVELSTIPAGDAWWQLPENARDAGGVHPSPNGTYLAAASIFSRLTGRNASESAYVYDDVLADAAHERVNEPGDLPMMDAPEDSVSAFSRATWVNGC